MIRLQFRHTIQYKPNYSFRKNQILTIQTCSQELPSTTFVNGRKKKRGNLLYCVELDK